MRSVWLTRGNWCCPVVTVWCFISSVWVQFPLNVSNHHWPVVGSRTMPRAWKHRNLTKLTRHWRLTTIMAINIFNMYIIWNAGEIIHNYFCVFDTEFDQQSQSLVSCPFSCCFLLYTQFWIYCHWLYFEFTRRWSSTIFVCILSNWRKKVCANVL